MPLAQTLDVAAGAVVQQGQPAWLIALVTLVTVLGPLIPVLVRMANAKATAMEAANKAAAQRDAVIQGVEKGLADHANGEAKKVKAEIKRTALERGVEVDLAEHVERLTKRQRKVEE